MESSTEEPMRRYKKVYRRPDYKNQQRSGNDGGFQSLPKQIKHDSRSGDYFLYLYCIV